ncbi:BLOC1S6 isoform 15 [Pan troglodytes]|uniref:Biogenesis of lysosomal organelles complex 1 subunit 6 n=3 Tax=Hominidae TaxID=9604 RepID=H3BML5_HUMAN|nr:BLOC1S6 isoform 15 [Pan troglodytes]PNJ15546.1 BLOC1S6 isoform 15 [Pongo abelii]
MSVPGPSSPDGALTRPPYCLEAGEPTPEPSCIVRHTGTRDFKI